MWFASLKDLKLLFYYLRMDHIFCTCNLDMYVFCCQFGEMLLHFNCIYKMDPMAEATTVAKDKFTLFVYCDATTLVSTFTVGP